MRASIVLRIGAADMGTGCDTILAQMAAECLYCGVEDVDVFGADTDGSPYDSGSYASSTTYVTGMAVVKACEKLKHNIIARAAQILDCPEEELEFDGKAVSGEKGRVPLADIATSSMCGNNIPMEIS